MSIKECITDDLKKAMRLRDQKQINALRLITAAIKQVEVDERITVDDDRMLIILDKLAKQRHESIAQFQSAQRHDLVAQEQYELEVLKHYLPAPLSEIEILDLIQTALATLNAKGLSDMGKVMNHLKPLMQGRADMSKVSSLVKANLA